MLTAGEHKFTAAGGVRVGVLSLQQAAERQLVVFFLVLLAVCLRTELAAAREFFEQGKLLPAVETAHTSFIGTTGRILKGIPAICLR